MEETMATVTAAKGCPFSNASIDFDPFDITDPFAFYEWARAEAPVFVSEELQYYVVAGHADIKAVFEDWRTFSSENAQAPLRPIGEDSKRIMREGSFTAIRPFRPRAARSHPHSQTGSGLLRPAPLQGDRAADQADRDARARCHHRQRQGRVRPRVRLRCSGFRAV
jgi:hypothetical protein